MRDDGGPGQLAPSTAPPQPMEVTSSYHSSAESTELLIPSKEERTAQWTRHLCQAARLLFLFWHGVFALTVSNHLDHLEEASWWLLFLPVWIGDALCAALVVASWFASRPYIRLCLVERAPRLGSSPSILTEVLPDIVLAVLGFVFLLLIFLGEYSLCRFLDSQQRGVRRELASATCLFAAVALLAICHGALLTHNSPAFLIMGSGLLLTALAFAATQGSGASSSGQAITVGPTIIAVAGLLVTSFRRMRRHLRVLQREERLLRLAEVFLLLLILCASIVLACKLAAGHLDEARSALATFGLSVCLVAVLRCRLSWWEAYGGSLEERVFTEVYCASGSCREAREVHIDMAAPLQAGYE